MLLKTVSSSSAAREFPWRNQGRFSCGKSEKLSVSVEAISEDMAFQSDASGTVKAASRDYGRVYSCGVYSMKLTSNVAYFESCLQDPDSVLGSLTHEIKEVGPDGQEVTKVVPAVTEEDQGIEILTEAIAACTETIDQHKGKLVVKETPRAVKHMAKLRMDDEEISGDEEEDTGMGEVDIEGAGIVE
ncbi:hypothetical protein Bca101_040498 [Brassica carinata]